MPSALDTSALLDRLAERGVIPGTDGSVVPLGGGVSGDVVAVESGGVRVVAKRPLPRLRVVEEWLADDGRVVAEASALRLAGELTPGAVPRVLDLDPDTRTLAMEAAPTGWRNWREELLGGRVDVSVARRLGTLLATWHGATAASADVRATFASDAAFVQLRIEPFHRTVARRYPALAPEIARVVDRLLHTRACLVHGDLSPKNVLVGDGGLWVLDWEVAHVGDPLFDVAFLCAHLVLKTVHQPRSAAALRAAATAFLEAYGPIDQGGLVANVGCLLVARVAGKSPADYLTESERETVMTLGTRFLVEPPGDLLADSPTWKDT